MKILDLGLERTSESAIPPRRTSPAFEAVPPPRAAAAPLIKRFDEIVEAYDLFGSRRDGVLKVAIRP